jgi:hypothetical protein
VGLVLGTHSPTLWGLGFTSQLTCANLILLIANDLRVVTNRSVFEIEIMYIILTTHNLI